MIFRHRDVSQRLDSEPAKKSMLRLLVMSSSGGGSWVASARPAWSGFRNGPDLRKRHPDGTAPCNQNRTDFIVSSQYERRRIFCCAAVRMTHDQNLARSTPSNEACSYRHSHDLASEATI